MLPPCLNRRSFTPLQHREPPFGDEARIGEEDFSPMRATPAAPTSLPLGVIFIVLAVADDNLDAEEVLRRKKEASNEVEIEHGGPC